MRRLTTRMIDGDLGEFICPVHSVSAGCDRNIRTVAEAYSLDAAHSRIDRGIIRVTGHAFADFAAASSDRSRRLRLMGNYMEVLA